MNGIAALNPNPAASSDVEDGQQIAADGFKEPEAAGTAPTEEE